MAKKEHTLLILKAGTSWAVFRLLKALDRWTPEAVVTAQGMGPEVPSEIAEVLGACKGSALVLLDEGQRLLTKELAVPVVSEAQQADAIEHEVENALPFPLAECWWDVLPLEEDSIEQRSLLLAARQADIDPALLGLIEAQRKDTARLEAMPTVFLNFAKALEPEENPAVTLILGTESSCLLFTGAAVPVVRVLAVKATPEDPGVARKLSSEIARGIAALRRQDSDWNPRTLNLAGAQAEAFSTQLTPPPGLELRVVRPEAIETATGLTGLEAVPEAILPAYVGAVLGLSEGEDGWLKGSLLSTELRARTLNRVSALSWWAAAALFLLAGIAWSLPPWWAHQQLEQARAELKAEIAPLRSNAAALASLEASIAQLNQRLQSLTRLGDARTVWNNTLVDLQSRLLAVENVWFDTLDLSYPAPAPAGEQAETAATAAPRLILRGRLLDPANPLRPVSEDMRNRVNSLIEGLEASRFVSSVSEQRFESLDGGLLQFTLTLNLSEAWRL